MDLKFEGDALMQRSREWSAKAATTPIDDWIDFWADDAVIMPPGLPPVRGKAAIRRYVEEAAKLPGFQIRWEPESVCVSRAGDLAYMIERNVTTLDDAQGNPVTAHGKVVTVWRKEADGLWRNIVDMWNEAPAPRD
jgi:ketosteroid isomerase-like protein